MSTWLLLWGCAGSAALDSGPGAQDTAASLGPCEAPVELDGAIDEDVDCSSDRCLVPAGPAWLGAADPEHPERCPLHQVELSAFRMDLTEVTVGAWEACVVAGACPDQPAWCAPLTDTPDRDQLPVTCIDWTQAHDYCQAQGGRLPTEAEWEKAARGTDGSEWPWGSTAPTCNYANFRFVSSYCDAEPAVVGSRPWGETPFGLLDAAGNTWEWVDDWYDAERYRDGDDVDPGSPEQCHAQVGDDAGPCVVRGLRGGAWNTTEDTLRPAARSAAPPETVDSNIGFRCAYDLAD